ncbi:hypothetical protein N2152v2_004042 [Parachlorella kessleri]
MQGLPGRLREAFMPKVDQGWFVESARVACLLGLSSLYLLNLIPWYLFYPVWALCWTLIGYPARRYGLPVLNQQDYPALLRAVADVEAQQGAEVLRQQIQDCLRPTPVWRRRLSSFLDICFGYVENDAVVEELLRVLALHSGLGGAGASQHLQVSEEDLATLPVDKFELHSVPSRGQGGTAQPCMEQEAASAAVERRRSGSAGSGVLRDPLEVAPCAICLESFRDGDMVSGSPAEGKGG